MVKVEVHFGGITRSENQVGSFVRIMTVTRRGSIIFHPNYLANGTRNDIGLVELPADAPIGGNVGIISLPRGTDAERTFENVMGTVSGFGRFSDFIGSVSTVLNYITQRIVSNVVCSNTFGSVAVTDSNICQESLNGQSSCGGLVKNSTSFDFI